MKYENLQELCRRSSSSRRYFLSLPVKLQMELSQYGPWIQTAAQLHETVYLVERHRHAVAISESLDPWLLGSTRKSGRPTSEGDRQATDRKK